MNCINLSFTQKAMPCGATFRYWYARVESMGMHRILQEGFTELRLPCRFDNPPRNLTSASFAVSFSSLTNPAPRSGHKILITGAFVHASGRTQIILGRCPIFGRASQNLTGWYGDPSMCRIQMRPEGKIQTCNRSHKPISQVIPS